MHHSRTLEEGIARMARELEQSDGGINAPIAGGSGKTEQQLAGVNAS
jgi:hypothetical protein